MNELNNQLLTTIIIIELTKRCLEHKYLKLRIKCHTQNKYEIILLMYKVSLTLTIKLFAVYYGSHWYIDNNYYYNKEQLHMKGIWYIENELFGSQIPHGSKKYKG